MAVKTVKSPCPIYALGAVWVLWALLFPMIRITDYLLCAALSLGVYVLTRTFLWKDRQVELPDPEPEPVTDGEKTLAALRRQKDEALGEMRRLNAAIRDPAVSGHIDHLEEVTGKIFDAVADQPEKVPQIRRFLEYYLPTTLKILSAYSRFSDAGVEGANLTAAKARVEGMLENVSAAFDKQLDSLFGAEALDISTDITVLEQLLAREGLGGDRMSTP